MSVKTKNQSVKLSNVVVLDEKTLTAIAKGENVSVKQTDARKFNPGRPVNKQSARYKRLAKQSFYTSQLSKFQKGNQFEYKSCKYSYVCNDDGLGYICGQLNEYVCRVNYIGRTKVLGIGYVLDKTVNVEINLKNCKFGK